MLSRLYATGQGVEKDEKKAFSYCQLAVSQKYEDAYVYLGYLFGNGIGVECNRREAAHWYCLAAEKNNGAIWLRIHVCCRGECAQE